MAFHQITAVTREDNGPLVHYRVILAGQFSATFTRHPNQCAPEVGDLVYEDGAVDGVAHYECLRPALAHGDNLRFNKLMGKLKAQVPEPGYWHYQVISALVTSPRGRTVVKTQQVDTACRDLLAAGAIWLSGVNSGPVWACIGS